MIEKIGYAMLFTVIIILLVACVYSCAANEGKHATIDQQATSDYEELNLRQIGLNSNGYNYLIDENTGVVYLEYDGYETHSISVMFNADGTVMIEKDILNNTDNITTPTDSKEE